MVSNLFFWLGLAVSLNGLTEQTVVVVVGAPGMAEYESEYSGWTNQWQQAASRANARFYVVGQEDEVATAREQLKQCLAREASLDADTLWLVLIGHGTFDGREAKFNLHGPDVSAAEVAGWLKACQRPLVVINCTSSSAPFLNQLAASERVVVTATKSGYQYNFAHFGRFLAGAIGEPAADLDKDEQTSLLEAFLLASSRVGEFYETDGRLSTEHALIDDNGDGKGTPADWFRGVRVQRAAKDGTAADGLRANQLALIRSSAERLLSEEQRQQRDELEAQIEALRAQKSRLPADKYYAQLEPIFVALAQLYATDE